MHFMQRIPENQSSCNYAGNLFHVDIFWVVTSCSVVGYQCFRGPSCLHLKAELARMGEKGVDTGLDWRRVAGTTSQ